MPRSTSSAILCCTLVAATWAWPRSAQCQAKPDKAREAILKEVEAAERRRQANFESLKRDLEQRAIERQKVAERNAADPRRRRPAPPRSDDQASVQIPTHATEIDFAIFGNLDSVEARRYRLEWLLAREIQRWGAVSPMTDAQKAKLALAGRGDVKRFLDGVADARKRWFGAATAATLDPESFRKLQAEALILRAINKDGPFGDGSYFAKALHSIRQREQDAGRRDR